MPTGGSLAFLPLSRRTFYFIFSRRFFQLDYIIKVPRKYGVGGSDGFMNTRNVLLLLHFILMGFK